MAASLLLLALWAGGRRAGQPANQRLDGFAQLKRRQHDAKAERHKGEEAAREGQLVEDGIGELSKMVAHHQQPAAVEQGDEQCQLLAAAAEAPLLHCRRERGRGARDSKALIKEWLTMSSAVLPLPGNSWLLVQDNETSASTAVP